MMMVNNMKEKCFTGLPVFCLVLTYLMLMWDTTKWYSDFIDFLYNKSIFTPIIIGILGVISAFIGIKGIIRTMLILLNLIALGAITFVVLIAIFGFQQP